MKKIQIGMLGILAMVGAGLVMGCNWRSDSTQPGPAERTGAAADQAAERARTSADQGAAAARDATSRMIEKAGEQVEKAGETIEKSGQRMQE